MIKILESCDFDKSIEEKYFGGRDFGASIDIVKEILSEVKTRGDEALFEYSKKFDAVTPSTLEISQEVLKAAAEKMQKENPKLYESLCYSRDLALRFAKKQKESFNDFEVELEEGLFTGQKNIAVDRAGVYVPAGRFPLVSTVVMTVTPAVAAGVKEIVLCTPPRSEKGGDENIMAAAYICGVTKAFACGGAQAVGAKARKARRLVGTTMGSSRRGRIL